MPTHPSHPDLGDDSDGTTRTRLPEGDAALARRPVRSPSRTLVTVVGIVVLLIAALAFATRGGGSGNGNSGTPASSSGPNGAAAAPTAPTGERPVDGKAAGIASGFPKSQEGAESAAANYAVALGGEGMFKADRRHEIIDALAAPSAREKLQSGFDNDYSPAFAATVGLNKDGSAPQGQTFVDRTIPAGAKLTSYNADTAGVSVWCMGLFGLAGQSSTRPVTSNWFTVTFTLSWDGSDWKVFEASQSKGPTPVAGDNPVSGANEIAGAVQEYGGFTYAR